MGAAGGTFHPITKVRTMSTTTTTTCAYCNRPATTYHLPLAIGLRLIAPIPLCGELCGPRSKKKGRAK